MVPISTEYGTSLVISIFTASTAVLVPYHITVCTAAPNGWIRAGTVGYGVGYALASKVRVWSARLE